ncbi:MAG: hypothetical protein KGI54_10385 [Pseudomonadota bacterium]|nr:hypothetical protein [Pseudomonadota bacterium]
MAIDWDSHVLSGCMDVFGEPVTYMPASGGSFPVTGVFNAAWKELSLIDDGSGVNTVRPVLGVRASQFSSVPVQGDKLSVASVNTTYVVRDVNPDSHGHINLLLNKVSSP